MVDKMDSVIQQQLTLFSKVHKLEAEVKALRVDLQRLEHLPAKVKELEKGREWQKRLNGQLLADIKELQEKKSLPEDVKSWWDIFKR